MLGTTPAIVWAWAKRMVFCPLDGAFGGRRAEACRTTPFCLLSLVCGANSKAVKVGQTRDADAPFDSSY